MVKVKKNSYSSKILNLLSGKSIVFNRQVARRRFRKNYNIESVMRTARRLRSKGLLNRVKRGNYVITKQGLHVNII